MGSATFNVCLLDDRQPSVYVMACGYRSKPDEYFMCKIGLSSSPFHRVITVRSSVGIDKRVRLTLVAPCANPDIVEQKAHEILLDKAIGREWFDCSILEAEEAVFRAIGIADGLKLICA